MLLTDGMTLPFSIPFEVTRPFFHALDAETSHSLTLKALKCGLSPKYETVTDPRLNVTLWDRKFPNPVGLAAGFDKNAEVIAPMLGAGFGFVEVGTVTPKSQIGNPRPRVFRDVNTESVINRMGFPNGGVSVFKNNIQKFLDGKPRPAGLVGINIGMNKDQTEPEKDYTRLMRALGSFGDYFTINISSPNTPGLRNLQKKEHLEPLIKTVQTERAKSCCKNFPPPILVKLAPDLKEEEREEIADVALSCKVDGLILGNTTLDRPDILSEKVRGEMGGLSGQLLTSKSTDVIEHFYKLTKGQIPIIGVGGISNAEQAYEKIKAGASLVQLYSALVYHGPEVVADINNGLLQLIERDGFKSITEATGTA